MLMNKVEFLEKTVFFLVGPTKLIEWRVMFYWSYLDLGEHIRHCRFRDVLKRFIESILKCELPKVIIRHNIGPISVVKSRILSLGQCHCLHRSSAGPTTAAFFDCLNLPTFSRNLAQYRPYTKPIVIFTMVSSSESKKAKVGLIDGALQHGTLNPKMTIILLLQLL